MIDNPSPDLRWGPENKVAEYPHLENDILLLLNKELYAGDFFVGSDQSSYTWAVFSIGGRFKGLKVTRWVPKNCIIAGKISTDGIKCEDHVFPVLDIKEVKEPAPQILIRKSELG